LGATSDHPDRPEWIRWEASKAESTVYEGEPLVLVFHLRNGVA